MHMPLRLCADAETQFDVLNLTIAGNLRGGVIRPNEAGRKFRITSGARVFHARCPRRDLHKRLNFNTITS
jgi:hypothetical protein